MPMPCPTECRLILDPPAPGPWNMAVDEVLLEWATESDQCCWRFYGWDEPTLSLGYFQKYSDRHGHAPSRACPAVRRLSGGGAIIHDVELTYSFVVPGGHPWATRRDGLYELVHTALIETLADMGAAASLYETSPQGGRDEEPFLCFQRRSPGDVVLGAAKIAGSAQRRRRGAVLQHGSVILGRSPAAPELPGIEDLLEKPVDPDGLAAAWLETLRGRLGVTWCRRPLSGPQRDRAGTLADARYASAPWTENRRR